MLSLLAQSLPHTSGGYATRSHGVLTGLAGIGWDVVAMTRFDNGVLALFGLPRSLPRR